MLKIIDGKELSKKLKDSLKLSVSKISGRKPRLVIISIGEDPASKIYIRNKRKACEEIGIELIVVEENENISRDDALSLIDEFNGDVFVDGIMVQEPLPKHLEGMSEEILPEKDVDGFTSANIGKLFLGEGFFFLPCTPAGIIELIDSTEFPIEGKHVVIIGRSKIVGKPLAGLLLHRNATVTICHSKTEDLEEICRTSDILISAVGKPKFVTREFIGDNTRVVIDVGINRLEDGKVVGDVDFDDVSEVFNDRYNDNYITPVPGGVGPMTVAGLMVNTVTSYVNKLLEEKS